MDKIFDQSLYNDDFFEWHLKHARDYSLKTMDWYVSEYKPTSVIDFGCGIGSYLESAYNNGIKKLKGLDIGGEYAKKYTPEKIREFIEYTDCTKELKTDKFDCVISFETAEHIEPSGTDTFVKNICNAVNEDGIILFTAAPEGQDGTGHINCHGQEYWVEKFEKHKLFIDSDLTMRVFQEWLILGAPDYICNNLLVFKK